MDKQETLQKYVVVKMQYLSSEYPPTIGTQVIIAQSLLQGAQYAMKWGSEEAFRFAFTDPLTLILGCGVIVDLMNEGVLVHWHGGLSFDEGKLKLNVPNIISCDVAESKE